MGIIPFSASDRNTMGIGDRMTTIGNYSCVNKIGQGDHHRTLQNRQTKYPHTTITWNILLQNSGN